LRERQERDGRIEDAAQVFDEVPIRVVLENVRVLLLGEASRVQDAVGRMLQPRAGRSHAVREVRRCDDSGRTRPGGSRAARRRRRRPLRRKQWMRSGCTVNFAWRVWRWSGASRPWPSRRQRGRVWRGGAKAKVRTDLDQHVHGYERECSTGDRLDSIQQARACTRQQAIFHPRQPYPANFFVILRISSL
jgi:hypothetical protein